MPVISKFRRQMPRQIFMWIVDIFLFELGSKTRNFSEL